MGGSVLRWKFWDKQHGLGCSPLGDVMKQVGFVSSNADDGDCAIVGVKR